MSLNFMDRADLVGGPYCGTVSRTLGMDVVAYNHSVYKRTYRVSPVKYDIYFYEYIGHLSDRAVRKQLDDEWRDTGWQIDG